MAQLTPVLISVTMLVFTLGAGLTFLSLRAYRRTEADPLRSLTVGFGAITVGASLDGLVWLLSPNALTGIVAGTGLIAFGLLSFVHALYVGDGLAEPSVTVPDTEQR